MDTATIIVHERLMCRVQSEVLPCVSVRFWGFSMMIDVQQQTAAHRVETRESQSASRKNTALSSDSSLPRSGTPLRTRPYCGSWHTCPAYLLAPMSEYSIFVSFPFGIRVRLYSWRNERHLRKCVT